MPGVTAGPPEPCCSRCAPTSGDWCASSSSEASSPRRSPPTSIGYARPLTRTAPLRIESPRFEDERIRLAIAERTGALRIEPAGGGRLLVELDGPLDLRRVAAACREARDRSWRAYRAVDAFSFSGSCRRRALLDHFGDSAAGIPEGRCCDVCDPAGWLPDPAEITVSAPRRARARPAEAPELSPADSELFEALRAWRLAAAAGKPAFTVAHDRTLEAIASNRPSGVEELAAIRGIGPSFIRKHAEEVLAIVAEPRRRRLPAA